MIPDVFLSIIHSNDKQGRRKEQTNEMQKKKMPYKFKKSNRTHNKQISHSDAANHSKDAICGGDISLDYCDRHSYKNILKIDENTSTTSQTMSNRATSSVTAFKHTSDCQRNIKSCTIKLDACAVQNWYMLNREETMGNNQNTLHNIKSSSANTLQTNKVILNEIHNTVVPQLISIDDGNLVETLEHKRIKPCSVVLCDNTIKRWDVSKSKKNVNDSIVTINKSNISHLTFNDISKTASRCNANVDDVMTFGMQKDERNLMKDSFVKMERLDIEKLVKKKNIVFNEKKQHMISSTPIGKCVRPSTYSVLLSPININVRDTVNLNYVNCKENSTTIVKESIPATVFPNKFSDRRDSIHSLITSECKIDAADMQEQQTQVLLSFEELSINTNFAVKTVAVSFDEDIHMAPTEKYNAEYNSVETGLPNLLNISAETDRSQSLFGDMTYNHNNHSTKDTVGNNVEKKYFAERALECKSAKADVTQNEELVTDNVAYIRKESESQGKHSTEISTMEVVCENSKDEITNENSKHSFLNKSHDDTNAVNVRVLLTQLQDPIRVTERRMQYPKWHLSVSNSFESSNSRVTIPINTVADRHSNVPSRTNNFQHSKNAVNSSLDYFELFNDVAQRYINDTNMRVEKSVFLKPGKSWTRSLSILNNINAGSNLDELSVGKGKKWRHSVRDILDMQKQGNSSFIFFINSFSNSLLIDTKMCVNMLSILYNTVLCKLLKL